ncbi:MAG: hypothetical protein IT576_13560 [Verrucomicrobiales bacterium]|nr:hypothetical protein [Verrucomicrobiales bacterium]
MGNTTLDLTQLRGIKLKKDSKGILGGLLGLIGFGLAASFLSRTLGFEVKKDDIEAISENSKLISAQWAVWASLVGTLIGLLGNWARQTKIAFDGTGKNPAASRGVMGNLTAILAGAWAFIQAVEVDWDQIAVLVGEGKRQWMLVAPAVMGIIGTVQGLWGRWRAKSKVSQSVISSESSGALLIVLLPCLLLGASCAATPTTPLDAGSVTGKSVVEDQTGATPAQQGLVAVGVAGLLRSVQFHGRYDSGRVCANATLFGFGPEICLGFKVPNLHPETPEKRLDEVEAKVEELQSNFAPVVTPGS